MIINPTKNSLKLPFLKAKAHSVVSEEKYRKPVPGSEDKFSEENFLIFQTQSIKFNTYREHGKNTLNPDYPNALLFLVHGLFAHMNRCAHIAKHFSKIGVTTIGFDLRGHGKSGGLPGYIGNFDEMIADFEQFTVLVDKIYPKNVPRFFMGQSMGGMLGFIYGLKQPEYFKGMMFFAPSLKQHESKKLAMGAAKVISYLLPKVPIPLPRKNDSSKNPAVFENILEEPYIYKGGVRPGTIRSLVNAMNFTSLNIEKFISCFIMVQGGMDVLVDLECNIDLFEKSSAKDKTLLFYDNLWHDIFHEEEIFEILEYLTKWLQLRIYKKKEKEEEEIKFEK